ncbi:MAG: N-methyl-L-tryptophan oxidase, partial [Alicyclobacillus shizuokensis]|nr:N-methyl-L-tryptophan oxidase [Alicyclobacillus shizuokensis]
MSNTYEVIVVGAGSMGMAAGWHLAQQGVRTLLIDAFHPPHTLGSHHGDTRIIRHAYGEGRQYVPLALRAQQLWLELQVEAGTQIFAQTGVLSLGRAGSPFMEEVVRSSASFDLPLEVLDAAEIRRRWPGWRLPDDYVGSLETSSGVLFSEHCIRAMRRLGEARGMQVLVNTPVDDIRVDGQGASVRAGLSVYTAERVIVTVGAWAKRLLAAAGLDVPVLPMRKVIAWFECDEDLYGAAEFPAFTCETGKAHYYGFPSFGGTGIKVGRHDGGQAADPDTMERTFG